MTRLSLRCFARAVPASALFLAVFCQAAPADPPWYQRALVGLEVGPTGSQFGGSTNDQSFARRFDGRDIVRATKDCGAEYLVMWAREGDWAFYNSSLQPKPPGLGDRDPLGEAVEEGRRLGLPVIAYCQVQYPGHALREHPEWRMIDLNGNPVEGRVCYRSGYLEYMKRMVEEQLAYGIAGFHLDMVDQGFGAPHGCWCDVCQEAFKKEYGHSMPQEVSWDEAWDHMLAFRYASSEQFEKELTAHIRQVNPRATVDYNYHGNPPFSWEVGQRPVQHANNADFVTGETGTWGFSALTIGLNAEFYKAATPGHPFQIAMQRGVRMYHDQTTRPLEDLRWELLTLLSHGGFVTIVDKTAYDGWLDPVAYERFQVAFEDVHAKRDHFGHSPWREAGIYFSSRTRDWYGREEPARYFQAFLGAHKAMVYSHIPWGVVLDENVSPEVLASYPVMLLPNAAILSEKEVSMFRQYVENGGNLVVTGLTGTRDWRGEAQGQSSLQSLIGAEYKRTLDSEDNWVRFSSTEPAVVREHIVPDRRTNWPFLVRGPAVVYEPVQAQSWGLLLKPHRTTLHMEGRYNLDWPLSADEPVGPAALLNRVGKGTVLTLAASPDWATASDHHIPEARRLLSGAVRFLNPAPRIRVEAPANVQAVVTTDAEAGLWRVHLLGYNTPPQTLPARNRPYVLPVPMETPPMYRATIYCRDQIKQAQSFYDNTVVETKGEHRVEVVVEAVHEIIQIRYEDP